MAGRCPPEDTDRRKCFTFLLLRDRVDEGMWCGWPTGFSCFRALRYQSPLHVVPTEHGVPKACQQQPGQVTPEGPLKDRWLQPQQPWTICGILGSSTQFKKNSKIDEFKKCHGRLKLDGFDSVRAITLLRPEDTEAAIRVAGSFASEGMSLLPLSELFV